MNEIYLKSELKQRKNYWNQKASQFYQQNKWIIEHIECRELTLLVNGMEKLGKLHQKFAKANTM